MMKRLIATLIVLSAFAAAGTLFAQGDAPGPARPDPFGPIRPLIGKWEGTGEGEPGTSRVEREYRPALGGRFIEAFNTSTYQPQEKNPKGEVHEDRGLFSYDRAAKRLVLRQFHVEGFVNHYVQQPGDEPGTIVFVTESAPVP